MSNPRDCNKCGCLSTYLLNIANCRKHDPWTLSSLWVVYVYGLGGSEYECDMCSLFVGLPVE